MKPYYDHGGIQIFLGDCREILPGLPKVDLVLTDPPYGIELSNHAAGKERSNSDWSISGDGDSTLGEWICCWAEKHQLPLIIFASPMKPWTGKFRQYLVWRKGEHVSGGGDPSLCWKQSWELIQIARNSPLIGRRDCAVLHFPADKEDYKIHPSPKPLALIKYLIRKQPHNLILDPFMGSGTTLRAAKDLGRRAIGIEIEERYCEIAARRLQQEVLQFK